jgi:protein TonB
MIEVKLADEAHPDPQPTANSSVADPDPQSKIPPPIPVAQPSAAIAFALPVEGPIRVVEARQAAYAQSSSATTMATAPNPTKLTFGVGEGNQPTPEYPFRAKREGQEGTVMVRFTVAEDGHVAAVEAALPSRWPLLNESALRTVKERWHFPPGELRVYVVPIRFELSK